MKRILFLIIIVILAFSAYSQYYDQGQNPPGIKWLEIKTQRFRLVFPEGFEDKAQNLANILERSADKVSKGLKSNPRRIDVILHTRSAYSNALVIWAPRRMEFYAFSPQDVYAQDWLSQLALHEYRHVVQLEALNTGITKVFSYIFGEQGHCCCSGFIYSFVADRRRCCCKRNSPEHLRKRPCSGFYL